MSSNTDTKQEGWHVVRSVDAGHILTTIVLAVTMLFVYSTTIADFDKRLALLESDQKMQVEIRSDVKELKGAIPKLVTSIDSYIKHKDETDNRQWERIDQIANAKKLTN